MARQKKMAVKPRKQELKTYFLRDSLSTWAIRIGLCAVLPVALSILFRLVVHGYDEQVLIRFYVLCIVLVAACVFLVIASVRGRPLTRWKVKHLAKPNQRA